MDYSGDAGLFPDLAPDGTADTDNGAAVASAQGTGDASFALVVTELVPFPGDGALSTDEAAEDFWPVAGIEPAAGTPGAPTGPNYVWDWSPISTLFGHDIPVHFADEPGLIGALGGSAPLGRAEDMAERTAPVITPIVFTQPGLPQSNVHGPAPALVPTDPLFSQEWHIVAINVESVWNDYTGKGITVGLIDDGVEYTHPDLAANYNTAIDYDALNQDNDAFTSLSTDQHGTSVAGVIAAVQGNGIGVVGVAFGATITGFRMGFGSAGAVSQVTDAFQHAINVDVVNNSWGYGGFFGDNFATSTFAAAGAAVQNDATNGRSGLGTVIVFAAGNSRASGDSVDYHGFQDSQFVISVAATDSTNHYASFSDFGAGLLLSAPGVNVTTTDRVGSLGFSSGDYTTVSGTSFSSPIVSGVVALMLDANPNLGYRDVQEILAYSSDKVDPANSRWMTNGAGNWNGGGLHFSTDYGFGLVDAHAAVRLAETWTAQSTAANMVTASAAASSAQAIPDNNASGITQHVNIASNILIDHVTVDLNITHPLIGDLIVTLIAPDGTQSMLIDRPGINPDAPSGTGANQANLSFTVNSNQFWGETSAGQWTLVVSDNHAGSAGTLNSWTLHVYGDPVTANDTYVYTDEYAGFTGAANAARRTLTDSDGGNDTVNAAAVSTSSFLDLVPGHTSTIAGNTLAIAAGTVIENAFGGDGNDTIAGNTSDNDLLGGRGNDSMLGNDGNDTIEGGAGNDLLDGGIGTNTAIFGGNFADYSVVIVDPSHVTVTDLVTSNGNDGTDSLINIQDLQFANFLDILVFGPPNNPPSAANDGATTNEDVAVIVAVLANDSDPDGDPLSVTGATNGAHGTVVVNPNGTVTYTPAANYNGSDSFTYTISDGHGGGATGTVNVTINPVNDPPVAVNDGATTGQNTPVTISVLANDSDVDGNALTVQSVTNPGHGIAVVNPNGTITYTPTANYNGADGFNYTISDGHGGTATASVAITVSPPPPPVTLINANFNSNAGGFTYADNRFLGTAQPSYESGSRVTTGGFTGGALRVLLGGINAKLITGMSGGWSHGFTLSSPTDVTLTFHYDMTQTANYESNEFSQVLVSVDGTLFGATGHNYVAQVNGDGNGGSAITTGWQTFTVDLGVLSAGTHTLAIGGYNNQKDALNERTTILIDDVNVTAHPGVLPASLAARTLQGGEAAPAQAAVPATAPLEADHANPAHGGEEPSTTPSPAAVMLPQTAGSKPAWASEAESNHSADSPVSHGTDAVPNGHGCADALQSSGPASLASGKLAGPQGAGNANTHHSDASPLHIEGAGHGACLKLSDVVDHSGFNAASGAATSLDWHGDVPAGHDPIAALIEAHAAQAAAHAVAHAHG